MYLNNGYSQASQNFALNIIPAASNLPFGCNPNYTSDDFNTDFPNFAELTSPVPPTLIAKFVSMANASLAYDKWQENWSYAMGLFVAHYATLYLAMTLGTSVKGLIASALPMSLITSKSVDVLSTSYDVNAIANDLEGFGTFKATSYGQQLATMAKFAGAGGMTVW